MFFIVLLFSLFQTVVAEKLKAVVKNHVVNDAGQGWCSANYVPALKKFLAIFVNHYSPGGYQDNSLRAFDPVTNTIEIIHPKNVTGAPQDRDNHNMVYNPFTNQIWVYGAGGVIFDVAAGYAARNTAPNYGAAGWTSELGISAFGAAAGVRNWPTDLRKWNAMMAWHPTLNIGVMFSGVQYTGMGVSNDLYLIKPNPTPNQERYIFVNAGNFDALLAPPGYSQNYIYTSTFNGRHNGRILGDYFYFLSVDTTTSLTNNGGGNYSLKVNLYRYDLKGPVGSASLTKMAPLIHTVNRSTPPPKDYGMNFPCVTADTKLGVLLVRLAANPPNNLYAYVPAADTWQQVETDVPVRYLRLGACDYSPDYGTTGIHAYQDGTDSTGNAPANSGWGTISLSWDSSGTGSEKAPAGPSALEIMASPNPFSSATSIQINGGGESREAVAKLYDISGKVVKEAALSKGQSSFAWDAAGFAPGIYVLKLTGRGTGCFSKKLLLQR